jgi:hypothetical protein
MELRVAALEDKVGYLVTLQTCMVVGDNEGMKLEWFDLECNCAFKT